MAKQPAKPSRGAGQRSRPKDPLRQLRSRIERERKKAARRGLAFSAPDDHELMRKMGRAKSPMIVYQSWTGVRTAGDTISYTVGIHNPDPFDRSRIHVQAWVGPANPISDLGAAFSTADPRFPPAGGPPDVEGLTVTTGATENVSLAIEIPAGVPATTYFGNSCVFRGDFHDVGDAYDRGFFPIIVT